MIHFNNDIKDLYWGGALVKEAYIGNLKVYPSGPKIYTLQGAVYDRDSIDITLNGVTHNLLQLDKYGSFSNYYYFEFQFLESDSGYDVSNMFKDLNLVALWTRGYYKDSGIYELFSNITNAENAFYNCIYFKFFTQLDKYFEGEIYPGSYKSELYVGSYNNLPINANAMFYNCSLLLVDIKNSGNKFILDKCNVNSMFANTSETINIDKLNSEFSSISYCTMNYTSTFKMSKMSQSSILKFVDDILVSLGREKDISNLSIYFEETFWDCSNLEILDLSNLPYLKIYYFWKSFGYNSKINTLILDNYACCGAFADSYEVSIFTGSRDAPSSVKTIYIRNCHQNTLSNIQKYAPKGCLIITS